MLPSAKYCGIGLTLPDQAGLTATNIGFYSLMVSRIIVERAVLDGADKICLGLPHPGHVHQNKGIVQHFGDHIPVLADHAVVHFLITLYDLFLLTRVLPLFLAFCPAAGTV